MSKEIRHCMDCSDIAQPEQVFLFIGYQHQWEILQHYREQATLLCLTQLVFCLEPIPFCF